MQGVLRIKDIAFQVDHQRTEFLAYIPQESPGHQSPWRLCWSLEVYCVEKEYERGFWPPCLYANELTFDVRDWRMIEGKAVQGKDEEIGAFLGVDESTLTSSNSIRFVWRRENLFKIEWDCLVDAYWDDDYSSGLPLRLDAEVAFDGVHVWWVKADAQGLASVKEMVGQHLDLACLHEPEILDSYHIRLEGVGSFQ